MSALSAIETPVAATDADSPARASVVSRERRLLVVAAAKPALRVADANGCAAAVEPRSSSIPEAANHVQAARRGAVAGWPAAGVRAAGPRAAGPRAAGVRAATARGGIAATPRAVPVATPILTGTVVPPRVPRSGHAPTGGVSHTPLRLTVRGRAVVAVLAVTVLSAVVLLLTTLVSGHAQATNQGEPRGGYQGMHQIVVRPGQTLWSIAAAAEPSADARNVVQEIMSVNALAGPTITTGQLLWVP
jgi:LysM domain-containing protein